MALTFLVGVLTTLLVREPEVSQRVQTDYSSAQYARFLSIFVLSVLVFIGCYLLTAVPASAAREGLAGFHSHAALAGFFLETGRLLLALTAVIGFVKAISFTPLYESQLVEQTYFEPVRDFFRRYGRSAALLLLVLIGFYRISDIVLGVIANVFFQDMGFTKVEIATVVKTFGLIMTIVGGFLGGLFALRFGVIRSLYLGAFLTVATNLLYLWLAQAGHHLPLLYLVISADNLSAGVASAAFVAFLSSLTNISFTAVQYAIFISLMTLLPKMIGGYSGGMVEVLGYEGFFLIASLMGVPVLLLVYWVSRRLG
jgi:PAT family beta-lactamase induction signal transducer AmpG